MLIVAGTAQLTVGTPQPATDGSERCSTASFDWDGAIAKAAMFKGVSWADALRRWERMGMDQVRAG